MIRHAPTRKSIWIVSKANLTAFLILGSFATALAPLVGGDQRNFLVIIVTFIAPVMVVLFRLPVTLDAFWVLFLLLYLGTITFMHGTASELSSLIYTALLAISYVCFVSSLYSGLVTRDSMIKFLRCLILTFGIVSVIQMIASLGGLPVPNLILSKGLWNYNSLAVEPSHLGRVLPISILVYVVLLRSKPDSPKSPWLLILQERKVIAFYLVSILLSGSTLAILSAPIALVFAFPTRWVIVLCAVLISSWQVIMLLDLPALQRGVLFMSVLPTLDLQELAATDHSATIRVAPALVYFDRMTVDSREFWFGSGMSAVEMFFAGKIDGVGSDIGAGFFPAFLIAFGLVGTMLTLWIFALRFLHIVTLPLIALWAILFVTGGWNTQLFWFGFMMLRVIHFYVIRQGARLSVQSIPVTVQSLPKEAYA